MVDFINEVEEELRKDKYNALLRKFGPYILALIFIVVAGAGFVEFQKYSKSKKARSTAASYTQASKLAEEGDIQAAIAKFIAIAEVAPTGYAGLSLSRAAGLNVQLGDLDRAVNLFDRSTQVFTLPIHKDLSSLKAAYVLMEQGRYDDVKTRVQSLSGDDAPYRDLAKELLAHIYLKTDDSALALTQFTYLANAPGVLGGVQARAKQAVMLIKANKTPVDLETRVDDFPEPTPVPNTDTQNNNTIPSTQKD